MNKSFFKHTTISLMLINVWILYCFFDYYFNLNCDDIFRDFGLISYYIYSIIFGIGCGTLLLIFRIYLYQKNKRNYLKNNFFYVFFSIYNLFIFLIWGVMIFHKGSNWGINITLYTLGNFFLSIVTMVDLYINKDPYRLRL